MDNERSNYPDYIEKVFEFDISPGKTPERLDVFLTNNIKNASRTKVQKAIEEGCVTVNGKPAKGSKKIQPGDSIICKIMKPPPIRLIPEDIKLDVVYEDDYLLVINKPPGMVTHPGYGNRYGTLVNAVLYHTGQRESLELDIDDDEEDNYDEGVVFASDEIRPGVVHRLDKDTSGLLVVSKNPVVHAKLAKQFADRTIKRSYNAIVWGRIEDNEGSIEGDIGRSPRDRKLFGVVKKGGKYARTDYKVIERFNYLTLLQLKLWTGRTHQIRVHCSHINHPVFGDPDYNGNKIVYGNQNNKFKNLADKMLKSVNRQMLHAKELGFTHPETKEFISFTSELPEDMKKILETLKVMSYELFFPNNQLKG